jgi:acyl carrier protein
MPPRYIEKRYVVRRKTHETQLNKEAHFNNDLGLDSLDTVEVVMAIEEVSEHGTTSIRQV